MKKIIVFILVLFIGNVFSAKAQFSGGTETKASAGDVISIWGGFNKSFGFNPNDGYYYVNIGISPNRLSDGTVFSQILTLSLGNTKNEVVKTLNAYKSMINSMEKKEWREITDIKTNITYKVIKENKNTISLIGNTTIKDNVTNENIGQFSISDIEHILDKL